MDHHIYNNRVVTNALPGTGVGVSLRPDSPSASPVDIRLNLLVERLATLGELVEAVERRARPVLSPASPSPVSAASSGSLTGGQVNAPRSDVVAALEERVFEADRLIERLSDIVNRFEV